MNNQPDLFEDQDEPPPATFKRRLQQSWPLALAALILGGWIYVPKLFDRTEAAPLATEEAVESAPSEQSASRTLAAQKETGWEQPAKLLGSTPARRLEACRRLGIAQGGRIVLLAGTRCDDCDTVALSLKTLRVGGIVPGQQVIAFVEDTPERAQEWKNKLGLRYPVKAISAEDWNDFAGEVTILPTVVVLNNGVAKAVRGNAPKAWLR